MSQEDQTALHISSRLGDVESVSILLKNGAACDSSNSDLYTPLHMAAKEGHDKVVEMLLENKADKSLKTKVHIVIQLVSGFV